MKKLCLILVALVTFTLLCFGAGKVNLKFKVDKDLMDSGKVTQAELEAELNEYIRSYIQKRINSNYYVVTSTVSEIDHSN